MKLARLFSLSRQPREVQADRFDSRLDALSKLSRRPVSQRAPVRVFAGVRSSQSLPAT